MTAESVKRNIVEVKNIKAMTQNVSKTGKAEMRIEKIKIAVKIRKTWLRKQKCQ